MSEMDVVRPQVRVLSEEQIHRIHASSLDILSRVGVRVDSEKARGIFARATGREPDRTRVRIPPELVERALRTSPQSVDVCDRRGNLAFRLGDDRTRFGIGVTVLHYQDPETDRVTPFARKHMEITVRLGGALPSFDAISTIGIVQDVPSEVSDLYAVLEMTANSVKPLVILVSDEKRFPDVIGLLEHLHGDLASRPFIVPYFNPITPLVMNKGTVDKMLATIDRGLPFIYSNYGMIGATTPITPAGALTMLNAELLAGLTLSQLAKEGTPVILGCLPAFFDMKGMGPFYDAHSFVINLACAEMMAHYRLPHAGTSGSGMGWGADLISGGHQWANHLTSCIGKVGLSPFVGSNHGSKSFSPATAVYANEVIAQARRFAEGFPLDNKSLASDLIAEIGPGGNFLTSDLTLECFRQACFRSEIWPNMTMERWLERGSPRADDQLRRHTLQLLDEAGPPEDHPELLARGEAFVRKLEIL